MELRRGIFLVKNCCFANGQTNRFEAEAALVRNFKWKIKRRTSNFQHRTWMTLRFIDFN